MVLLIYHTPFHLWVSAHAVHSSNSISPLPFTWMPCAHPSRLQHRPHLLQEVSLTVVLLPRHSFTAPFMAAISFFVTDSLTVCPLQDKVLRGQSVSHSAVSDSLRPHGLYSLPCSSVHGIFQAGILVWVAISVFRGQPRFPALQKILY